MSQAKPKRPKAGIAPAKISDEVLIQLANEVKNHECVWDLSNQAHKKSGAVDHAWEQIATNLGFTGK